MDEARFRYLGAWRPAALHPVQDVVLGGAGPGRPPGRGRPVAGRKRRPVASGGGSGPKVDRGALLVTSQAELQLLRRVRW